MIYKKELKTRIFSTVIPDPLRSEASLIGNLSIWIPAFLPAVLTAQLLQAGARMTGNRLPRRPGIRVSGFTLMELMVGVGIIGILAVTGAAIFFRSLRGSSQTEIRQTLDSRITLITGVLSRYFLEGEIVTLDGQTKATCLLTGQVNGDSLVVAGLDKLSSTISVSGGQVSSVSGQTVVINPESVTVNHKTGLGYYFSWYCSQGVPDRLLMQFTATSSGQQGDTGISGDYSIDVTMRNSGQ